MLTLLHSEKPKLHTILAFLSSIGLNFCIADPPVLKFLKRYRGQIILGSVVTGVWLGYQWIPQTVLLPLQEDRYRFYSLAEPGAFESQELNSTSLSLIEQVLAGLKGYI